MGASMSVRTDVVNLVVNVNGNQAQNNLNQLRKKAADLSFEMKGLKKNTEEYRKKAEELKGVTAQMDALKKQIGITALSQKELVAELNKLKALKGSVVPFSKEFKDLDTQIKAVEKRLYDVRNGVQGFSSFFSKIKDEVKQFGMLAAGYLGFQFISSQFQNIIRSGAKVSDQLADISRVAGLTAEETKQLNEQLKQLNTRTSTDGLREIAIVAGKLGITGVKNITDFTAAVDKLVVALGDELGDANQITEQLGKILNVFEGQITGDNITRAGNALVDLANKGVASGRFVVDFTQRLGGIAKAAGIALPDVFALGAGIEEMGGRSESASTALIKIINDIAKDIPKAAKIAGIEVKAFTQLFAEDPTQALLAYSKGLVANKAAFSDVVASMKDAGEEGARVVSTISILGNNTDFFNKKIIETGQAFKETGKIQDAFNLKNETFGATIDKLGKEFNRLVTSSTVLNFFQAAAKGALAFIRAIREIPTFIRENRVALLTLVAGLVLLNRQYIISAAVVIRDTAARWLNVAATRAGAVATNISVIAQAAYITITNALIGRITAATAAQRLWNLALSIGLGPLGILVTVVGVLGVAIGQLSSKTKLLTADQRNQSLIQEKVTQDIGQQLAAMERLSAIARDNNLSLETRKKALDELIRINPQYLSGLNLENIAYADGIRILDAYSFMLRKVAEDKAKLSLQDELLKERTRLDAERPQLEIDAQNSSVLNPFDRSDKKYLENLKRTKEINNQLNLIGAQIKGSVQGLDELLRLETNALNKLKQGTAEYAQQLLKVNTIRQRLGILTGAPGTGAGTTENTTTTNNTGTTPGSTDKNNDFEKRRQAFIKELERFRREAEIAGKTADEQEIARIEEKYRELLEKAKEFAYGELEIEGMKQAEIERLVKKGVQSRIAAFNEDQYKTQLEANTDFFNKQRQQQAQFYNTGQIDKETYENNLTQLERDETANRVKIAGIYSKTVKQAAEDLKNFKKTQEQQITKDLLDEVERRKRIQEQRLQNNVYNAQRNVLTTQPGTRENLSAKKEQLNAQFDLETTFLNKTSELYLLKDAELKKALRDADAQYWQERINQAMIYVDFAQQAFTNLAQILNNADERSLQRERRNNERKKDSYKKQLDSKLINQAQYDLRIQQLDKQLEEKQREAKIRQAKREKALGIFNATINTAAAIIKMLADPGGFAGLTLSILAGITGGLQIAAIASQPLPEFGDGDWLRKGKTHRDGGIPVEVERDEAIMAAAAMTDPTRYIVSGTPAQITSALNSRNGGNSWAAGGKIIPMWQTQETPNVRSTLPAVMAAGNGGNTTAAGNSMEETNALLNVLIQEQKANTEEIKTMKTKLKAVVSIKEFREQENLYDTAASLSTLKQTGT